MAKRENYLFSMYRLPRDPIKDCPKDCVYRVHSGDIECCDYILAHLVPRGCKGGKDCKEYRRGKTTERREWIDRRQRFT